MYVLRREGRGGRGGDHVWSFRYRRLISKLEKNLRYELTRMLPAARRYTVTTLWPAALRSRFMKARPRPDGSTASAYSRSMRAASQSLKAA